MRPSAGRRTRPGVAAVLRVVYAADLGSATLAAGLYPEWTVAARRAAQNVLDVAVARAHERAADVHVDATMQDGRASAVLLGQTPHAELLVLVSAYDLIWRGAYDLTS